MAPSLSTPTFSTDKHTRGLWDTRALDYRNPALRRLLSYISYKRDGVDTLAKTAASACFVLDAGAGKGAYGRWFLGRRPQAGVVAIDWSYEALRALPQATGRGRIFPVCADLQKMPFKSNSMDALYSIDTLGHVPRAEAALDEFMRVCKKEAPLFVHSECGDYRSRWPDRILLRRLGKDLLAEYDGHVSLYRSEELYALYSRRFVVGSFINPAGYLGWLLGYPEKYQRAFLAARWGWPAALTGIAAVLKNVPLIGAGVRLLNALTNHSEVFFGLKGGGSCFAHMRKP